jgi:hypothetical protein
MLILKLDFDLDVSGGGRDPADRSDRRRGRDHARLSDKHRGEDGRCVSDDRRLTRQARCGQQGSPGLGGASRLREWMRWSIAPTAEFLGVWIPRHPDHAFVDGQ